ncbi:MAG TPA: endonuclease [Firmicutes bacterium]|nr:endonuclease [Bacillota bacterium]
MKVMTFNLRSDSVFDGKNRWRYRKDLVIEVIKKHQCDMIGVQEVTHQMRDDLMSNLKNYHIVGEARTQRFFVEHNNILVSKDHTILEHETFWLSKNPNKSGSSIWYSVFPRICTTAKVKLNTGEIVRVYNTHLDIYLSPARVYGLKKISEHIKRQYELDKIPVILMGDFNTTPNQKLISDFMNGHFENQKFVAVQEYNTSIYEKATMGYFKDIEKGLHLDYIFVSDECEVVHADIIKDNEKGRFPSDHYPMVASIKFSNSRR